MREATGDIFKFPKDFKILNNEDENIKYSISKDSREKIEGKLNRVISKIPNLFKKKN